MNIDIALTLCGYISWEEFTFRLDYSRWKGREDSAPAWGAGCLNPSCLPHWDLAVWLQALQLALGHGRGAVLPLSAGAAQGPTLRGTQEASIWAGLGCPVKILNRQRKWIIRNESYPDLLTVWFKNNFFFLLWKRPFTSLLVICYVSQSCLQSSFFE